MARPDRHRNFYSALLAVVLVAAACGSPQESLESNTVGTNAEVGNVLLRNVHLAATEEPYRPGDTAVARLMLFNQAHARDALVDARSPQAQQVRLKWDQRCDGSYEQVDRIPILPEGSVPNAPNQETGANCTGSWGW
jgi:hypothetical protein